VLALTDSSQGGSIADEIAPLEWRHNSRVQNDPRVDSSPEANDIPELEPRHNGFTESDVESVVVAHYAVNLQMSYEDIERMLGLSKATVARRLGHVKEMQWLLPPKLSPPPPLQEECLRRVQCVDLQQQLQDLLKPYGLHRVTVLQDKRVRDDEPHEVLIRMGQAAATRLVEALGGRDRSSEPDGVVVGVNWGYSTRWTIQHLTQQDSSNSDLAFVPLIGNLSVEDQREKEYEEAWRCSANRLARQAGERFMAREARRLTTPAIIPRKFLGNREKLDTVWEFIEQDPSYLRIFGSGYHNGTANQDETLIGRMDTIITGMSALEATSSLVEMARLIDQHELDQLRNAGYLGDLGGHLIHDPEQKITHEATRKLAESLGDLVISARPDDFRAVAQRADPGKRPWTGVFMVGRGVGKAPALLAACRMGAVTELFTDRATAQRMAELLGCPGNGEVDGREG